MRTHLTRSTIAIMALFFAFGAMGVANQSPASTYGTTDLHGVTAQVRSATTQTGGEGALVVMQMTLEPGARIRTHEHPGAAIYTVESGLLQTRLARGAATVTWFADGESAATGELATIGSYVELAAGDTIAYGAGAAKNMVNVGEEPVRLVVSMLLFGDGEIFILDPAPRSVNPNLM